MLNIRWNTIIQMKFLTGSCVGTTNSRTDASAKGIGIVPVKILVGVFLPGETGVSRIYPEMAACTKPSTSAILL